MSHIQRATVTGKAGGGTGRSGSELKNAGSAIRSPVRVPFGFLMIFCDILLHQKLTNIPLENQSKSNTNVKPVVQYPNPKTNNHKNKRF